MKSSLLFPPTPDTINFDHIYQLSHSKPSSRSVIANISHFYCGLRLQDCHCGQLVYITRVWCFVCSTLLLNEIELWNKIKSSSVVTQQQLLVKVLEIITPLHIPTTELAILLSILNKHLTRCFNCNQLLPDKEFTRKSQHWVLFYFWGFFKKHNRAHYKLKNAIYIIVYKEIIFTLAHICNKSVE